MLEALLGFGAGIVVAIIVGLLVWRNNRSKWGQVVDQLSAYVDQYDDPQALKIALLNLVNKIKN